MTEWWRKEMSPIEALKALLQGEKPDRVLVCPSCVGHSAKIMGYKTLGEYYEFPKVWFKCTQIATDMYNIYCPPVVFSGRAPVTMGAWGAKFMYPYAPKMGAVALLEPALKKPDDIDALQIPDPKPFMNAFNEAIELAISHRMYPLVPIPGGWITSAGYSITTPEQLLFWIYKQPELAHKILQKSTDYGIKVAEEIVRKFGTDSWAAFDGNPTDSNTLISPDTFAKFPLPEAIRLHQKVLDMGVPMWFTHFCANHNKTIAAGLVERLPMGKPGILQFGPEVTIEEQVARFGKRNILIGNVDPPSLMIKSYDEVIQLCKKNVEVGMNSEKGYMLGCGCELPPQTPPANVFAMVKVAREYGKYSH